MNTTRKAVSTRASIAGGRVEPGLSAAPRRQVRRRESGHPLMCCGLASLDVPESSDTAVPRLEAGGMLLNPRHILAVRIRDCQSHRRCGPRAGIEVLQDLVAALARFLADRVGEIDDCQKFPISSSGCGRSRDDLYARWLAFGPSMSSERLGTPGYRSERWSLFDTAAAWRAIVSTR
jgi:hypothetical protein